jgi:hypothetical protein
LLLVDRAWQGVGGGEVTDLLFSEDFYGY